jgi:Family of unknown function (DUF5709)
MREEEYPTPLSDPEAEGLPGTADDDSGASDDVFTGREADGVEPAALPADQPTAVDRFGSTAQEQLDGESLDYKVARERAESSVDEPLGAAADPDLAGEADSDEAAAQSEFDADVMGESPTSDPHSPVSIYDHGSLEQEGTTDRPVGRLTEPDEGTLFDDERDAVGFDAGTAGGGATAEEAAVHETRPPD